MRSEKECGPSVRVPSHRVHAAPAPVLLSGGGTRGTQAAKVVPFVEDGVVRYVEIHCSCGNVTVLECVYDEEGGDD